MTNETHNESVEKVVNHDQTVTRDKVDLEAVLIAESDILARAHVTPIAPKLVTSGTEQTLSKRMEKQGIILSSFLPSKESRSGGYPPSKLQVQQQQLTQAAVQTPVQTDQREGEDWSLSFVRYLILNISGYSREDKFMVNKVMLYRKNKASGTWRTWCGAMESFGDRGRTRAWGPGWGSDSTWRRSGDTRRT